MQRLTFPNLILRQFSRAPLASSGAADTVCYDRRDCERIDFSLRGRVSNPRLRSARIRQSNVMKQGARVGQFNPVWQHNLFLRKINTVLIRLKFSRRSCYTGVMHDGSENGVASKEKRVGQLVLPPHDPRRREAHSGKTPKERHPARWYRTHIMVSTETPDRVAAKAIGAEIAADVERQFKALRDGPKALTAKQVSALSGVAYRAFALGLEDNPGLTAKG